MEFVRSKADVAQSHIRVKGMNVNQVSTRQDSEQHRPSFVGGGPLGLVPGPHRTPNVASASRPILAPSRQAEVNVIHIKTDEYDETPLDLTPSTAPSPQMVSAAGRPLNPPISPTPIEMAGFLMTPDTNINLSDSTRDIDCEWDSQGMEG